MANFYVIDANVMIEAAKSYYAFDRVPGFWTWMDGRIAGGVVKTASLVAEEIDYPEALVEWLKAKDPELTFIDVSHPDIQQKFSEIATWTVTSPFGPEHIAKFLAGADPWLVAAADVRQACVVTQETHVGPGAKKVKIPNVCEAFGVRCIHTFEMLGELNARF
jgi:hypothetical protein